MAASSGVYVVASDGALTVFESIFVEYLVCRPERSHRRVLIRRIAPPFLGQHDRI
jgi:hypothetical protein